MPLPDRKRIMRVGAMARLVTRPASPEKVASVVRRSGRPGV
jgi:hypothetical protein